MELPNPPSAKVSDRQLIDPQFLIMPHLIRREIGLPAVPIEVLAVIGMRPSGKTCSLSQCMADFLAYGAPRESLVMVNFEDRRLAGMDASSLSLLLESYHLFHAEF
jgi:predicted AAA+ superfamily ATPase